jgi:PAS domain S-box-containing protein
MPRTRTRATQTHHAEPMTEPQHPPQVGNEHLSLDYFRDRLVTRLLYVLLGVGLLAVAGSLTRALDTGWHPLLWLHSGLYLALLIAVVLATRLSSIARRLLLLGILLILAIAGIAVYGLLGLGPGLFVVFCTLTAALLGTRVGLVATVVSALAIATIGALAASGHHHFDVDPAAYLYSAPAWINAVTGTLMATVLAATATGFLLRSLESRHDAQRTTEDALRSERDLNTAVLDTIGALVVVLDNQGHILNFNLACQQITGYTKQDAFGRKVWDFLLTPEEQTAVRNVFSCLTAGQFPNFHENDWVARDGTRHRIAWSNTVLTDTTGGITHVIATGIEISRLVQAEAALIRSEERLRLSQRYAHIGTWDWDITTGAVYWSEEIGHLFGYGETVPETTFENFLGVIHPDDRQRVIDAVNACVERDIPYEIEHRVVWPDGSVRWLLERGGVTRSADGEPLRMLGIVQDITERKQAAKSLTESEELFREFAENTEEVFWVRDLRSNRMIYASPAYENIWGRSCTALLANPLDFLDAVHPDDLNSVREGILHQQRGEYFNRDYRIIRTDGQIRWVHVHTFPIRNSAGVVYRIGGLARDITRQQEMEADRIRHERAQVQTLVREVHHRIKNHLQGIVGLLDEHASRFPAAAPSFINAIMQIRSIALAHGLQGQGTDAELHLCEIVPAVAQSVAASLNTSAAIETRIDMDWSLRIADADTVPLALIINELLVNCLKHRPPVSGNRPVRLHLHELQGIGRLMFTCPGARLPESFDFEQGVGLGTGLGLVKSLLPREGVTLTFRNEPDGVCCEMTLQAPVVLRGSRVPGNTC